MKININPISNDRRGFIMSRSKRYILSLLIPLVSLFIFFITGGALFVSSAQADEPTSGLVGWWRAEGNGLDSASSNNTTVSGSVTYAAGRSGQAFSFNGSDGYADKTSPDSSLNIGNQSWTISAWVKSSCSGTSNQYIVSRYECGWASDCTSAYPAVYELYLTGDGYATFYVRSTASDGVGAADSADLRDGAWHHISGVLDRGSSELKLFVDGRLKNSTSASGLGSINDSGSPLEIGRIFRQSWGSPGYYFNGLIDEVRIYNRALTASEVYALASTDFIAQTQMPLSATIVSNPVTVSYITSDSTISIAGGEYSVSSDGGSTWSTFSTTTPSTISPYNQVKVRLTSSSSNSVTSTATLTIGTISKEFSVTTAASGDPNASGLVSWWKAENNAYDSVGGNHGTAMNGATYATGKVGQAFSFDGTDDYVNVGDSSFPAGDSDRSVSLWIKTSQTGEKYFFSYGPNISNQRFSLGMSDNRFHVENSNSGSRGTTVINDNEWHHLVAVWSSPALKMYVDGIEQQATIVAPWPSSLATVLTGGANIGRLNGLSGYDFNGLIDEVKIFNRALSSTEVATLAGKYTLTISKDGTGSGTVSSSPSGIDCGSACSYPFDDGTSVDITASAASGSTFSTWSGACTGNGIPCTVVMSEARAVTATFNSKTDFSGTPLTGQAPLNVSFTDTSTHSPTSWAWTFGDGGTSTQRNPVHTYRSNGTYTVELTATGTGGASTMTKTGFVLVGPDACSNPPYKINGTTHSYDTIQHAYDPMGSTTMQIQALVFTGGLTLNQDYNITLKGGYDCGFTSNAGESILSDKLTIKDGKATIENIIIK
jgi:PKD repeat protein